MIRRPSSTAQTVKPTIEPVTLAQAKARLRVLDDEDDEDISLMITEARELVEGETNRALIQQTFVATLDEVEAGDIVELRNPILIAVSQVKVYDKDDAETVVSTDLYQVITSPGAPGRVVFKDAFTADLREYASVEITYTAGFGAAASDVPEQIKSAIKELVYYRYDNRDAVLTGSTVAQMPFNWERLINRYRIHYIA